jgi:dihydrolipoamide dehydrogenase
MPRRFMRRIWAKKSFSSKKTKRLGGVCLNRGCIPSKALLYATHQIVNARNPRIAASRSRSRSWIWINCARGRNPSSKNSRRRGRRSRKCAACRSLQGRAYFEGSNKLRVETESGQQFVEYDKAILAVGSLPAMPKAFDLGNPRVMTSTEALEVEDIPENLLVVGGGYIGMELGTVYAGLGSKITLVEALGRNSRRCRCRPRAARRGQRQKNVQGNPAQGQA